MRRDSDRGLEVWYRRGVHAVSWIATECQQTPARLQGMWRQGCVLQACQQGYANARREAFGCETLFFHSLHAMPLIVRPCLKPGDDSKIPALLQYWRTDSSDTFIRWRNCRGLHLRGLVPLKTDRWHLDMKPCFLSSPHPAKKIRYTIASRCALVCKDKFCDFGHKTTVLRTVPVPVSGLKRK